ncbi:hypothetical protein Tco_0067196 [Tanacetum coccineum]
MLPRLRFLAWSLGRFGSSMMVAESGRVATSAGAEACPGQQNGRSLFKKPDFLSLFRSLVPFQFHPRSPSWICFLSLGLVDWDAASHGWHQC